MLGRHLLGYLPVQAAQALVGFGGVAVFTRLMGQEEFGRFALVMAALSLAHILAFTWLEAAVARYHARAEKRGRLSDHLATAYGLFALCAVFALAAFGGALLLFDFDAPLKAALGFALVQLIARSAMQIGLETHRAAGNVARYSALEAGYLTLGFTLGVGLLLFTDMGAAGVFAGSAVAVAVVAVFDLPAMLRRARPGRRQKVRAAAFARYGAPISASLIFEHLLSIGDRFLINWILGAGAVGVYAAGYGLADRLIDIIFIWFGAAVWPLTIRALEQEGGDAAKAVAARAAGLMALIAFPAAAGLALVATELTGVIVGPDLREGAAAILPWIALSGLMNGMMTYYFHEAFTLTRRTGVMAAIMAGAAVLNLVLNLLLLPHFGLIGAAMATVLAYFGALCTCILLGRRYFVLPVPLGDWAKAACAAGLMALAVWALPEIGPAWFLLLLKAMVGAAVYGIAALALNIAGCRHWVGEARRSGLLAGAET